MAAAAARRWFAVLLLIVVLMAFDNGNGRTNFKYHRRFAAEFQHIMMILGRILAIAVYRYTRSAVVSRLTIIINCVRNVK